MCTMLGDFRRQKNLQSGDVYLIPMSTGIGTKVQGSFNLMRKSRRGRESPCSQSIFMLTGIYKASAATLSLSSQNFYAIKPFYITISLFIIIYLLLLLVVF